MPQLISTGSFVLLSIFGTPVEAKTEPPTPIIETIEQKIDRIAIEHGIATTTLFNLAMAESSLNPNAIGDMDSTCLVGANKGLPVRAKGLMQITQCYNPDITDEQAFNPDWALNWGADIIARGDAWKTWVVANCYSYAKSQLGTLPAMKDINPNTDYPVVGGMAVFYYSGVKHVAVITKVTEFGIDIKETNYEPMKFTRRTIKTDDKNLVGFWRKD